MKTNNTIYVLIAIVIGAGLLFFFTRPATAPTSIGDELSNSVDPKEESVVCTQDVMECPDGSYVGRVAPSCEFAACPETNTPVNNQMIEATTPQPGDLITSPLQLAGEATGPWYFEATAPVELRDWQDNVIAQSYITAQADWMTNNVVPFIGEITFTSPYSVGEPAEQQSGSLVFKKANPTGQPEFDDQVSIPILFAPQ